MNITFTRLANGNTGIFANDKLVGYIEKSIEEQARMIKGTNLRHAQGRKVARYDIMIARRHFVNAPLTVISGFGGRTLAAAKIEAAAKLEGLTLKG